MSDLTTKSDDEIELTEQSKVKSLFRFIKELNIIKQKSILDFEKYMWNYRISNMPNDEENIRIKYRDRVEYDSETDDDRVLLSVKKPEFTLCPRPDEIFSKWLIGEWESFRNEAKVRAEWPLDENSKIYDEDKPAEKFGDNEERVSAYMKWINKRNIWVDGEKIKEKTLRLFRELYQIYCDLQRDSETNELIVANGIIIDKNNKDIKHPVLTRRTKIVFDSGENIIYIVEPDVQSELYTTVFQNIENINLNAINESDADLQLNDYHPLDRIETPEFLRALAHNLSSECSYSDEGIPENWTENGRLLIYTEPCYIYRKRLDGTLKAIEQIINNIDETGEIPAPIGDIVSGGKIDIPEDTHEETIEEQLAAVGGESVDILLSKEANKEQLEIAKRIELYNAVLVQGPPGTGKTHTIANLMGHFLAQGKSVLVTSHTTKALKVLKEKVEPELQSLCVSVLEDSNEDMERSIDGIIEYSSNITPFEIKKEIDRIGEERKEIIENLADVRRKLFKIINQECNCIVCNGEDISPSDAAKFVLEHSEDLSYIPGKVRMYEPLPLTFSQLADLYRSNESLTEDDESELAAELPSPSDILTDDEFEETCDNLKSAETYVNNIISKTDWTVENDEEESLIEFSDTVRKFKIRYPEDNAVKNLKTFSESFNKIEEWMKYAAVDGKNGGAFRHRWDMLIEQIEKTCEFSETLITERFGHKIEMNDSVDLEQLSKMFIELKDEYEQNGKISFLTKYFKKDRITALESVTINGKHANSAEECQLVIDEIKLREMKNQCELYWDELLGSHNVKPFRELDSLSPEGIAKNMIPNIKRYLSWYEDVYDLLISYIEAVGISSDDIFVFEDLDSDLIKTEKILKTVEKDIPAICDICLYISEINECKNKLENSIKILRFEKRIGSRICGSVADAIENMDTDAYVRARAELSRMFDKYVLQNNRIEMLKKLLPVAPQWAVAIQNREGIHGNPIVPADIEDAWKWKQLSAIIEEMTEKPFSDLQEQSVYLSKQYRKITAKYAEKCAWYHLLKRTEGDLDIQQALTGWKKTIKKIGKGTGKNVGKLREEAKKLMSKCQEAVPAWIMTIIRALETLNPRKNRFDVVIIDEASQSDVSSLPVLYMGKKLIIVGDDKQVSPMAVGVDIDKINSLQEIYLKDKIPNAHLYDGKTSIYDIAGTTFQPLMLREHFRCVPEIIGFSNMLSYDFKILPLRDAGNSTLLPAVVNYRVEDGKRENKTNIKEAETIVNLMKACFEQPEYEGKTFGVISLLGDDQVKLIQRIIEEKIPGKERFEREILCGNASNFQGDERDVIFLSLVDSGNGTGPLKLTGNGVDDSTKKRYNVATSRAKDQLWVVDSLDPANDLKSGDIRKTLIDYSINPLSIENKLKEYQEKSESPFEMSVVSALGARGYHMVQQWKVGAYRIDMVAVCGNKTVAIECDGERFHSGESKIREDMERQTILERLGWRFIRIRGSEYYRNPDAAIEKVIKELDLFGIKPESSDVLTKRADSDLLNRVKIRANEIAKESMEVDKEAKNDLDTVAFALNEKSADLNSTYRQERIVEKTNDLNKTEPKKSVTSEIPVKKKVKLISKKQMEGQQVLSEIKEIDKIDENNADTFDVIKTLKKMNIEYIDKRANGGSLWIVGGKELEEFVKQCAKQGVHFIYKPGGGRATKGRDAWWTKG